MIPISSGVRVWLSAVSDRRVLDIEIERLKLEIARLRRERYGQSAERGARIEQLELSLEDLEETAAAIEAVARIDALFAVERDIAGLPTGERLPGHPTKRVNDLLPWNWQPREAVAA